jgi:hypothetical protein
MNLLNAFLRDPTIVRGWGAEHWNRFLPLARNARLLGRCLYLFEQHDLLEIVPQRLVDQLRGALAQTRYMQVQARRELRQVWRICDREGIALMALKGVAYLLADLPPAGWRNLSDIDVMVPESDIERTERALLGAGWAPSGEFDAYDQHYYREWMHEVPPLRHRNRETEVDLHHNLAPPVSRIKIEAPRLWHAAVQASDPYGLTAYVLSPADMLLHNSIHLFMNDELRGGLRDVMDFRDLYEHFLAQDAAFDTQLLERADEMGCGLPLYYAVMTAQRLVGLAASPHLLSGVQRYAPIAPVARLMHWLIEQALAPSRLGLRRTAVANWLLFIRSHWVRMPPLMLARHLVRKAIRQRLPQSTIEETPG